MKYDLPYSSGTFTGEIPVKGGVNIDAGGLFAVTAAGIAVPVTHADAATLAGRAEADADNTGGADGDISISGRRETYAMENSAAAPVTAAHFGATVYAEAPDTVRFDQSVADEPAAGKFLGFDPTGLLLVDTRQA